MADDTWLVALDHKQSRGSTHIGVAASRNHNLLQRRDADSDAGDAPARSGRNSGEQDCAPVRVIPQQLRESRP
jgi:hypothetical protein